MNQKKYLVACLNQHDALNAMMRTFAKMQNDFAKDAVKYSESTMSIVNNQLMITFVTKEQVVAMSQYKIIFVGVDTTKKFAFNAPSETKEIYRRSYLKRTLKEHRKNDRNGILGMYLWKGR